ncbi:MAG: DNA-3-methyladenine glycosylase [Chloroflexota bacterium]
MIERLERDFYRRDTVLVAGELLGMGLVRLDEGERIAGVIIETEAYRGEEDLACHARAGLTPRTAVMYGPAGHAYVYFNYGMHWLFNIVTEVDGVPGAVLIRGIAATQGLEKISQRRVNRARSEWTNGPAKLCQALGIDKKFNGLDLCAPESAIFIEKRPLISDSCVTSGPRVGLKNVPEPWKSMPWRFKLETTP